MSYFDDNEDSIIYGMAKGGRRQNNPKVKLRDILDRIEEKELQRNEARFLGERPRFKKITQELIDLYKALGKC